MILGRSTLDLFYQNEIEENMYKFIYKKDIIL